MTIIRSQRLIVGLVFTQWRLRYYAVPPYWWALTVGPLRIFRWYGQ